MNRLTSLAVALAATASLTLALPVNAQIPDFTSPMPGIVVAGSIDISRLPSKAHDFIKKHFKDIPIVKCQEEYMPQEYEVEFADGTEVDFDAKGEWVEVDAGTSRIIPATLVKDMLPRRAHDELSRRNVIGLVETIKRGDKGYKVELRGVELDDYRFARDGKLISVK